MSVATLALTTILGAVTTVPTALSSPTTATPTTPTGPELPNLLLSFIVWSPLLAAIILMFLPDRTADQAGRIRLTALAGTGLAFVLTFFGINGQIGLAADGGAAAAYDENHRWLDAFSVTSNYHLAADGVALTMLIVSTTLFACVTLAMWKLQRAPRHYCVLLLLVETGVNGVICAQDVLLLVVFWGMQLIPLTLLISGWGGPRRGAAAIRFLAHAGVGTGLITTGLLISVVGSGVHTFDMSRVLAQSPPPSLSAVAFWLLLAGLLLIFAAPPFHGWMVEVAEQAHGPVAMVAVALVTRLGALGMVREIIGMYPGTAQHFSLVLVGLALAGALWAGLAMFVEDDIRRLVGWLAAAQTAPVLLAVGIGTQIALMGAVLELAASALTVALLLGIAAALEERVRVRRLAEMGGLASVAPRLSWLWMLAVLSAIGVPFLAGFSGDISVLLGSFPIHRIATLLLVLCGLPVIVALLRSTQRIFFGPAPEALERLKDASSLELGYLLPLVAGILLFGLLPGRVVPIIANGLREILNSHIAGVS